MTPTKSISDLLVNLTPKRISVTESSYKKTNITPQKSDQLLLKHNIRSNIRLNIQKGKEENLTVLVLSEGNADVFAGSPGNTEEKRQSAECHVSVETVYTAKPGTTEGDLKEHQEFFKGQSSITVYNALRSLVAHTDFHGMPLPLQTDS